MIRPHSETPRPLAPPDVSPEVWRTLLEDVSAGSISVPAALERLGVPAGNSLHLDHDRARRCGIPEVVYGGGKTPEQIEAALCAITARADRALATRVDPSFGPRIAARVSGAVWHPDARCIAVPAAAKGVGRVAVLCAGTSDLGVAEEARITAETCGSLVDTFYDVGVAGLHRLLGVREEINRARALVVVAGMEGALPSVVGGLVRVPVIAVPTSVGYGASFGGVAALLGMLNSCAPGVSVVNIDNGFGAGVIADRINRLVETGNEECGR